MTPDITVLFAQALFWVVAAGVAFLPMRWAIFCFILASHLDITTDLFASATSVGFENTVRIIVLPAILFWRTGFSLKDLAWSVPQKLWLALIAYAAISGLWSGFQLSAAKMVVYLIAFPVLFLILCAAWANRWVDIGTIRLASWCAIGLAFVQTFMLGNPFGGIEERFTSFTSPQYFAACMISLLAILVFSGERGFFQYATCAVLILGVVLSGSRYIFVCIIILLTIASFRVAAGEGRSLRWRLNFKKVFVTMALVTAGTVVFFSFLPSLRFEELFNVFAEEDGSVQHVGTFFWRLGIYQDIFTELEKRSASQLSFGSGTSSGARLMLDRDPDIYDKTAIDGNRALHSEFLRALYEWGILGLALLSAFLIACTVGFVRKMRAEGGGPALAYIGVLPSILTGLAIENLLAGACSAAGVGILLAMSFAWQMEPAAEVELLDAESFGSEHPALPV